MTRKLEYLVFDADNHMYEATDAFTKYLPPEYEGVIKYVEVNGRTKIAIKNKISDYIPNPTFNKVAPPGRAGARVQAQEPRRRRPRPTRSSSSSRRRSTSRRRTRSSSPRPASMLMDEQGIDRAHDVADAGEPARGAPHRRSRRHPRRRPRAQPVDARAVDVQLRGPDLPHARSSRCRSSTRRSRSSSGSVERGAKAILIRPAPVPGFNGRRRSFALPEFDPFWEKVVRGRHRRRHARLRQRLPALHERVGGPRRRVPAVQHEAVRLRPRCSTPSTA